MQTVLVPHDTVRVLILRQDSSFVELTNDVQSGQGRFYVRTESSGSAGDVVPTLYFDGQVLVNDLALGSGFVPHLEDNHLELRGTGTHAWTHIFVRQEDSLP